MSEKLYLRCTCKASSVAVCETGAKFKMWSLLFHRHLALFWALWPRFADDFQWNCQTGLWSPGHDSVIVTDCVVGLQWRSQEFVYSREHEARCRRRRHRDAEFVEGEGKWGIGVSLPS